MCSSLMGRVQKPTQAVTFFEMSEERVAASEAYKAGKVVAVPATAGKVTPKGTVAAEQAASKAAAAAAEKGRKALEKAQKATAKEQADARAALTANNRYNERGDADDVALMGGTPLAAVSAACAASTMATSATHRWSSCRRGGI